MRCIILSLVATIPPSTRHRLIQPLMLYEVWLVLAMSKIMKELFFGTHNKSFVVFVFVCFKMSILLPEYWIILGS